MDHYAFALSAVLTTIALGYSVLSINGNIGGVI